MHGHVDLLLARRPPELACYPSGVVVTSPQTCPDAMPPPISTVHHVAVLVRDLALCEHFYGKILGLPLLRRWPKPEGDGDRSLWFDLGQGAFLAVELNPSSAPELISSPGSGWHLLALGIPRNSREAWREHLHRAGHPCTHESPYTLYCRDPEGNRVGLSHWPEPATE
jgi:catechol 2,3-dioxygenase-like lactoylglutathione lyase family enzyme